MKHEPIAYMKDFYTSCINHTKRIFGPYEAADVVCRFTPGWDTVRLVALHHDYEKNWRGEVIGDIRLQLASVRMVSPARKLALDVIGRLLDREGSFEEEENGCVFSFIVSNEENITLRHQTDDAAAELHMYLPDMFQDGVDLENVWAEVDANLSRLVKVATGAHG